MRISALTFILTLGLSLILMGAQNRLIGFEEGVLVGVPSLSGFEEIQKNVFRAVKTQSGFHSYNTPIALDSDVYYRIRYDIRRLPREKITVTTDFFAPSYDNPEQERATVFGMTVLGKRQDIIFNTGESPSSAHFRLFYSGPPGLEIQNVQITRVPVWSVWLKRGLFAVAFGALLVMAMTAIQRLRNSSALLKPFGVSTQGVLPAEVPAVAVVYFCAVLIRYMVYIVMPSWSGDEYAYKSIAAGIWHFGQHGVLTDKMVAHSVDLPNLLYPFLVSPAFMLGEDFYFGMRLINAVVINTAIIPCYLIARRFLDVGPALAAASISIAIPFVNLGAFAVTEVLFFPLFLLSIWIAIEGIEHPRSIRWNVIFGVVAAILLNVRLNALVLLPAYLVALLWISLTRRQAMSLFHRPYWLVSIITFLSAHIFMQFFLGARKIGGVGLYSHAVTNGEGPFSVFLKNPVGILHLIAGHLTTLAIPYALPIALIISVVISSRSKLIVDRRFHDFLVITTIFSSALFILALVFTISVSPIDLGGLGRWHSRYYFYFYPLVIIAGAIFAKRINLMAASDRITVTAIIVLLLAVNVYFIKLHGGLQNPWFGSIADNMDVQWYRTAGQFYWFFVVFTLVLTWLWNTRSRHFLGGLVCFIFAWVIVSNFGTLRVVGVGAGEMSDTCGSLGQNFLDHHPGRFVIVGDSRATMVSAAFWNPYLPERTLLHGDSSKYLDSTEVGVSTDYLIVNGDIQVDSIFHPLISIGKCVIYELPN